MTGELKREEVSAFGYDAQDLMEKLKKDEEFKSVFMEQFGVVQKLVKEFKEWEKETKKQARAEVADEKERGERLRLREVIEKIQSKDSEVVLEPEEGTDNFFEGSSIKYLKEWVKNYRSSVKLAKEAEKQAKIAAKEAKLAVKEAKAQAKKDKQIAQMEKMAADLKKWNDLVEFEVVTIWENDSHVTQDDFVQMKAYHTRIKLLVQLAKFAESVEGVPEYDVETIKDDDLKEMHARCKVLNQLVKLDSPIDYGTEKSIEELKAAVVEAKTATTDDN
tara:strand:- start:1079 stop:1906 length:828 start_codon:yes stop_codon:yes gene_type:complete